MARGLLDSFGLSNVAWTIATLQQHTSDADETQHAALLDALAQQACDAAASFKAQEVCNLLWAFATLKRRHLALFQRFAAMATAQMGEMSPHGLSQTFWAYSKLDLSTPALLLAAAQAALRRLDTGSTATTRSRWRRWRGPSPTPRASTASSSARCASPPKGAWPSLARRRLPSCCGRSRG